MRKRQKTPPSLTPRGKWLLKISFLVGLYLMGISAGNKLVFADHHDKFQEYQVKAAFLYNFAKFVEWPAGSFPDPHSPLVLAVIGKDPFGEVLESLKGKGIGNRKLVIKRFADVERLEKAHLLFISDSEKDRWKFIQRKIESTQTLMVSDLKGFCEAGGHIGFYLEENKVRFEINPEAAQRNGLKISSQLLKLAKIVRK
jgi:hypothetical protein